MGTAAAPSTTTWNLDATHSSVEFSAKHLMITTVKGRFADIAGTVTVNSASPSDAVVDVTIQAASIDSRTEGRDQHLRSADFLDVEKYPTITFKSTKIEGAKDEFKMTGDLTIHGVTKSVTLDVTNEGEAKDPWGGRRMGFTASTKIDRRQFGLVWNGALEAGGVLVSNDIKIQIDAQIIQAV